MTEIEKELLQMTQLTLNIGRAASNLVTTSPLVHAVEAVHSLNESPVQLCICGTVLVLLTPLSSFLGVLRR